MDCRAFDVAVVGSSLEAYFAALRLRQAGKSVLLVEGAHEGAPDPIQTMGQVAMHLPDADPALVSMGAAAAAAYRQLFDVAGARGSLVECDSVDIGRLLDEPLPEPRPDTGAKASTSAAAAAAAAQPQAAARRPRALRPAVLATVASTCEDLRFPAAVLSHSQFVARYPGLRMFEPVHSALLCEDNVAFNPNQVSKDHSQQEPLGLVAASTPWGLDDRQDVY